MTPEHSPAPWKENGGAIYYDKLRKDESFVAVLDADGQLIAKVMWSLPSGPHNAALIVKAPEKGAEVARLKAKVDDLRALLVRAAGMIPPGCQLEEDIADALGEEEKP